MAGPVAPGVLVLRESLATLASLVLESGAEWGAVASEWQWEDARAVLDPSSSVTNHELLRPRGGSKTGDIGGYCVALLLHQFAAGEKIVVVAADTDQARYVVEAIDGYVQRTPALRRAFKMELSRVRCRSTGAQLEVMAADAPSAFGLRGVRLVVLDEFYQWRDSSSSKALWTAIFTTLPKVRARLVIASTAGDPAHSFAAVHRHALESPRWRVSSVPGPVPWIDTDYLAEQQALLPPSLYARYHLNEWCAGEDRLADVEDLAAAVQLDGPQPADLRWRYVVTADLGLKHDRTVITAMHAEPTEGRWVAYDQRLPSLPRVVVDRMEVLQGSRDNPVQLDVVESLLMQFAQSYRCGIVMDPWQLVGTGQRLQARGYSVFEFAFTQISVGRIAATLRQLLSGRLLALPDDPELLDELANIRLRESTPGVFRLDHDPGRHDDRAVAIALGAHHLVHEMAKPVAQGPHLVMRGRWAATTGRR